MLRRAYILRVVPMVLPTMCCNLFWWFCLGSACLHRANLRGCKVALIPNEQRPPRPILNARNHTLLLSQTWRVRCALESTRRAQRASQLCTSRHAPWHHTCACTCPHMVLFYERMHTALSINDTRCIYHLYACIIILQLII